MLVVFTLGRAPTERWRRFASQSELSSGADVLIVAADGACHTELVGRVKIERRPLLRVDVQTGGRDFSVLLQNAETVRLIEAERAGGEAEANVGEAVVGGRAVSVVELRPGCKVLAYLPEDGARHAGIAVRESILER